MMKIVFLHGLEIADLLRPYQEPYQPGHWCYGTASGQGYSHPEAIQLHDKGRPFREAGAECFHSPT